MISLLSHLVNSGSPLGAFIYFIYIKLMYYEKLAILAKLNDDLKCYQDEDEYLETKRLIEKNQELLLQDEVKLEEYSEKVNKKLREEFEKECSEELDKAKYLNSRWLSDGSLEVDYLSVDGEVFTKVYQDDNIFAKRQAEREEKKQESIYLQWEAVRKFWHLFLIKSHQNKKEKFAALI